MFTNASRLPVVLAVLAMMTGCLPASTPVIARKPAPGTLRLWQDAAIFNTAARILASSNGRLLVEMYEFGRRDLAALLVAGARRGRDVRVILDPTVEESVHTGGQLRAAGVQVRYYPIDDHRHQIDHVKLLLASQAALVGGMNWGSHSDRNHDYCVELTAPDVLSALSEVFEQDWRLAGGAPAPHRPAVSAVAQTAPGEDIRALLEDSLVHVRNEVRAEVFVLTDAETIARLVGARRRGVLVRVLLDPNQDVNRPAMSMLRQGGVEARWFPVPRTAKLHAKVGLFDGRLLLGSANWSLGGLSVNHELDVAIDGGAPAAEFARRFDADWALAPG